MSERTMSKSIHARVKERREERPITGGEKVDQTMIERRIQREAYQK